MILGSTDPYEDNRNGIETVPNSRKKSKYITAMQEEKMNNEIFKILKIDILDWEGLLALANVEFPRSNLTVRGFRIMQSRESHEIFCGLPVFSYKDSVSGRIVKKTLLHLPQDFKEDIYFEILKEYERVKTLRFEGSGDQKNESGGKGKMTKCKVKFWSLAATDLETLSREVEDLLNSGGGVRSLETFIFRDKLVLIVVFQNDV